MYICALDWRRWLAGVVIACGLVLFVQPVWADRILAVVGDEVITQTDLNKIVKAWDYQLRSELSDMEYLKKAEEIKKRALNRLIEECLLYLKAKDEGITVDSSLVEKEIEKIKERFSSQEEFIASLKEAGMTPQDLYNQIEKKLMIQRLINEKIRTKIYINPTEIAKTFKRERQRFCTTTSAKLDSIFVPFSKESNQKGEMAFEMDIMDKYMKLKDGILTWRDLKDKYGQGPISGWRKIGDLSQDIAKEIFSPMSNEVYPMPVKVSSGYMFFRVEERKINCPENLDEAKEKIYRYLFGKKFNQNLREFVNRLKKEYYVKIYSVDKVEGDGGAS